MTPSATQHPPTVVAVFGALTADRVVVAPSRGQALLAPARAVLERVLQAIASSAPSISQPILDRAVAERTITRTERHALLRELLAANAPGEDPPPAPPSLGLDAPAPLSLAARGVLREALAAIRRAAPGIAQPILDEAVDAERLTAAQEQRILERLRASPSRGPARPSPRPSRRPAGTRRILSR